MQMIENILAKLDRNKIEHTLLEYPKGVRDTVLVAKALGVHSAQLFKSLVIITDGDDYKMLIIPSDSQLNFEQVANQLNVNSVLMASRSQAEAKTGMLVGGISPFGIDNPEIEIFIDESVKKYEWIVLSAGKRGFALKISVADLLNFTNAKVIKLL
jgi:Cys-tRNA(Pro)/Cys-tRNA(Cys) deacylase